MKRGTKLIIFSSCLLLFLAISIALISAQSGDPSFFRRWADASLNGLDAKLLLLLMISIIFIIILMSLGMNMGYSILLGIPAAFILTAFATPDSIVGIFRTYNTLPLTIATLLPLSVLFALTYLAASKGQRSLIAFQFLAWWIYFAFNLIKLILAWMLYVEFGVASFINESILALPPSGTEQFVWFWIALLTTTVVAFIMSFMNGKFMNLAIEKLAGIDSAKTTAQITAFNNKMKLIKGIARGK